MTQHGLSSDQQARYRRDGFLFPIDIMSPDEALSLRRELETLECETPDDLLPMPVHRYMRVNSHYVITLAARLANDRRILDAVASILGDDLIVWGCEFFIKEPGSDTVVTWHQAGVLSRLTKRYSISWTALRPARASLNAEMTPARSVGWISARVLTR